MILLKVAIVLILANCLLACEPENSIPQAKSSHQYSERPLVAAALSSDASQALMLSIDGVLSLWDTHSRTLLRQWHQPAFDINENVYYAALSANQQFVAVAGRTRVSVLSVNKGDTLVSWQPKGFDTDATITVLELGHSNENVWLGMSDGSIITVDLLNNKQSMFAHHQGPVADIQISDNQQKILSSSTDGSVVYWNAADGSVLNEREQNYRITSLAIDPASQRVFLSDALKSQLIWSLSEQNILSQLSYFGGARTFRESLFIDQGRKLITASSKQKITLWQVRSGGELGQWQASAKSMASTVFAMASARYGQVHTLTSDGVLEVWQIDRHIIE